MDIKIAPTCNLGIMEGVMKWYNFLEMCEFERFLLFEIIIATKVPVTERWPYEREAILEFRYMWE